MRGLSGSLEVIDSYLLTVNVPNQKFSIIVTESAFLASVMDLTLTWIELRMFYYIRGFFHWQRTQTSALSTIYVSWR